jgi:hypothetical protein
MITKEEFKDSFYYIAPGFDFEPLRRFSNLCTHFFYANLYFSKQEVLENINMELRNSDFIEIVSIKEHDNFDELKDFEIHPNYRNHFDNAVKVFTEKEKKDYFKSFVPAMKDKQWMLEIELKRKGLDRNIKLYYFTGEGLASYIALSHNGVFSPKVVCTIQTGVLENANGLMSRFLMQTETLPLIWVRGYESHYNQFAPYFNDVLSQDKLYNEIGMDFNFEWSVVGESYTGQLKRENNTTKRYCKAFITNETKSKLKKMPFKTYHKNKIVKGDIRSIIPENNIEKTAVFIPEKLSSQLINKNANLTEFYWENISNNLLESLNFIEVLDDEKIFDKIYMTVNGLEDEGVILDKFLMKDHHAKMTVVVKDWLDLIELRVNE